MTRRRSTTGSNLLGRRGRWLAFSFSAVTLGVMALAATRLSSPLPPVHWSVGSQGKIVDKTRNPYRGAAGTVYLESGEAVGLNWADTNNDRQRAQPTNRLLQEVVLAPGMTRALEQVLAEGITDFVHQMPGGATPQGRELELSLDPTLQAVMQRTAECFTGNKANCPQVLPKPLAQADPRFSPTSSALRAGAAAFLLVHEASGRVLAMGGSVSDCSKRMLGRKAVALPSGGLPVFADSADACSQFPDARHADWMGNGLSPQGYRDLKPGEALTLPAGLAMDPSQWTCPPGSTAKIGLAVACQKAGLMTQGDAFVRAKFAVSSDNDYFKGLALRCVDAYRALYAHYAEPFWLIHPQGAMTRSGFVGWAPQAWPKELPAGPTLQAADYLALDGKDARRQRKRLRLDSATQQALATSRYIATIAIGNGGHQSTLASHAALLRGVGLASQGLGKAPVLHLVKDRGLAVPELSLQAWPDAVGSQRVLSWLGGVTGASGTARQACLRVVGNCPAAGLSDVQGKTGTSDITTEEDVNLVKRGFPDPVPSKLFVARFRVDGQWYVVASQVLRARDPATRALDESNAAAELGLLARRALLNARGPQVSPHLIRP